MSRVTSDYNRTVIWPDTSNTYSRYATSTGTSVASPITTGVIALMLQATISLSSDDVATILKSTAIKDQFTGPLSSPDNHRGSGKINALGALSQIEGVALIAPQIATLPNQSVSLREGGYTGRWRVSILYSNPKQIPLHCALYAPSGRAVMLKTVIGETVELPQRLARGVYVFELFAGRVSVARQKISLW